MDGANEEADAIEPYHDDDEDAIDDEEAPLRPSSSQTTHQAAQASDDDIPLAKWCFMTAAILSTTFVISLLVDDLSIILGFVGSVGSTTISFILPGVLYASLFRDQPNSRLRKAAVALAAWGVIVLVVALSANILKLVHAQVPSSLLVTTVAKGRP